MKVIVPQAIDLNATDIAANGEAVYASGTTYTVGDLVQVTDIFPNTVYRSLRSNNTGRYPPSNLEPVVENATSASSVSVAVGSKSFTIQAGKTFSAGMMVNIAQSVTPNSINMTGEVTSYSGTALVVNVTSVTGAGTYTAWTITSEDEIGFWEEVSATNQHLMFDSFVNTKSVNANEINVAINTTRADAVALFGVVGTDVELSLWDATETTEYWSDSVNLIYASSIATGLSDWYEYFFGEYSVKEDIYVEIGVVSYEGILKIRVIANTGTDAEVGNVVLGRSHFIGASQYGASVGIKDYSYRDTDDNGRTILRQGYWAKKNDITLYVPNEFIDSTYNRLSSLRGIPTAWIGNNDSTEYESLIVYGFYNDFSVTIEGPKHSWCDLEIEGLI